MAAAPDPFSDFYYTHGRAPVDRNELDDWLDAGRPGPTKWNGQKYLDDDDVESAVERVEDPDYECQVCGNKKNIPGEHRRHAGSWCDSDQCGQIRNHERLKSDDD